MENQKLQSSPQTLVGEIPDKWKERFLIKRIDEKEIEITIEQRDAILSALNKGQRFIQVGKYTLMLNSIRSIDPFFEPDNIPPRPNPIYDWDKENHQILMNEKELDLWDNIFGKIKSSYENLKQKS